MELKKIPRAYVYSKLIPVITSIASYYILNEIFTVGKIAGILIVVSGLILTQINKFQIRHE